MQLLSLILLFPFLPNCHDLGTSEGNVCRVGTTKSKVGIQGFRCVHTDHCRWLQQLRKYLDVVEHKILTGCVSVAFHKDGFSVLETRKSNVVPARLFLICQLPFSSLDWKALTSVTQEPSPGLNELTVPVMLAQVKFSMLTVELFGLPIVVPFSS